MKSHVKYLEKLNKDLFRGYVRRWRDVTIHTVCRDIFEIDDSVSAADSTSTAALNWVKFHGKALDFANVFDQQHLIPEDRSNIRIVLSMVYNKVETASDQEICGRLAWLHIAIQKVGRRRKTYDAILFQYLYWMSSRTMTGLAAALETMVIANLYQRHGSFSDQWWNLYNILVGSIDTSHMRNAYCWNEWTPLEKITYLWLRGLQLRYCVWPACLSGKATRGVRAGICSPRIASSLWFHRHSLFGW